MHRRLIDTIINNEHFLILMGNKTDNIASEKFKKCFSK